MYSTTDVWFDSHRRGRITFFSSLLRLTIADRLQHSALTLNSAGMGASISFSR